MTRFLTALWLVLMTTVAHADAELITKYAVKQCSGGVTDFHRTVIGRLLAYRSQLAEFAKQSPRQRELAQEKWSEQMEILEDEMFKYAEHLKAGVTGESAQFMVDVATTAANVALVAALKELMGTVPGEDRIRRVFVQACEAKVYALTENARQSQQARREKFDRRMDQIDRDIARDERADRRRSGEALMNLGLSIMGAGGGGGGTRPGAGTCHYSSSSVSGFHKTCYYQCVTGVVTSTVGAAEMCPPTR